jgi:hypothetical protein
MSTSKKKERASGLSMIGLTSKIEKKIWAALPATPRIADVSSMAFSPLP